MKKIFQLLIFFVLTSSAQSFARIDGYICTILQIIFHQMLAHARWRAEREFPAQWDGHKLNINVVGAVTMSEALDITAGELLDQIAKE